MAKSNQQLLSDAIVQLLSDAVDRGDLEKARELTAKLVKAGKMGGVKVVPPEKAPRSPAKVPSAKKATGSSNKAAKPVKGKPRPRKDLAVHELNDSDYLAPSRPLGMADNFGGRKFIGADGKEHTYAKRVSMEGIKFVNKFKPDQYTSLPPKHEKVEKKLQKFKPSPKPGQRGSQRDVAKKVEARCTVCRNVVLVYPWEADTVDGESNFRCSKKSCIKAR
jgi:hypothetical protein